MIPRGDAIRKASIIRFAALKSRARWASTLGLFLSLLASGSAFSIGTPEQREAGTRDVYRRCAREIPIIRAIAACLRRQKASLREACRAVVEQ